MSTYGRQMENRPLICEVSVPVSHQLIMEGQRVFRHVAAEADYRLSRHVLERFGFRYFVAEQVEDRQETLPIQHLTYFIRRYLVWML
jgi:hypothetical protein